MSCAGLLGMAFGYGSATETRLRTEPLANAGRTAGARLPQDPTRDPAIRGGSVVFRVPDFQAVHAELAAREIICDYRPDAGLRFGPQHSTTAESWFMSVPGLKIVCPSSPA